MQLLDEILKSAKVLLVLVNLELEFSHSTLFLGQVLVGFLIAALFSIEFTFEFADALFEFGNYLKKKELKMD